MPLPPIRPYALAVAMVAFVGLAGCDTAEERAEGHYQNAIALLEEGDVDRAVVEFRNVFKLNGLHREARLAYAEVMREQGEYGEAYRHYLLLSEQFPNDPAPLKWLFRIAAIGNDAEQARTHGERALRLAPEDPDVQAMGAILDYQTALEEGDAAAQRAAADRLETLAGEIDDRQLALPALVDNYVREDRLEEALAAVDSLLAEDPSLEDWQQLRLRILTELGDEAAVEAQLERLVELFPENPDYPAAMVQWHMARGGAEPAESFLRSWIEAAPADQKGDRQAQLAVFVAAARGPEAAIEELDRMIGEVEDPVFFRAMRAGLLFDMGAREDAIAQMAEIVGNATAPDGGPRTDADFLEVEVNLARMLLAVGRVEDAQAQIEQVLAKDGGQVGALKLRAAWLIEQDRDSEAIAELRTALASAPEDPEIMTLIAEAHMRNGSRRLAGEMLALAVEASGNAAEPALAYARFLMADEDRVAALDVLRDALRASPDNIELLALLGQLYVERADWARASQTEASLRRIGTEAAVARADALRVGSLRAQERGHEALRFLTDLAESGTGNAAAQIAVARAHMESGNFEHAEAYIDARLAENPGDPVMRMLRAALYAQTNRGDRAEEVLRGLVREDPSREIVWRTLYETKLRLGEIDAARGILDEALAVLPDAPDLLWAKAGEFERDGDLEGAIGIYEALYERLPNSVIVANNLASLLSRNSDDAATLDRAYTIARRLRGSDVPAFQDTYGWIAHLRGETSEALEHLEPAAAAIPDDPSVQYHLGMAYAAAGRLDAAAERLRRAIDLAGPRAGEPLFEAARAELAAIEQRLEPQEAN